MPSRRQVRIALDRTISDYLFLRGTDLQARRQSTYSGCQPYRITSGKFTFFSLTRYDKRKKKFIDRSVVKIYRENLLFRWSATSGNGIQTINMYVSVSVWCLEKYFLIFFLSQSLSISLISYSIDLISFDDILVEWYNEVAFFLYLSLFSILLRYTRNSRAATPPTLVEGKRLLNGIRSRCRSYKKDYLQARFVKWWACVIRNYTVYPLYE